MNHWRRLPKLEHVAKYIDCYWYLEKEGEDISHNYPKLNPDPTTHLIIASPNYDYQYVQGDFVQKGSGSHWIFPHRHSFTMDHSFPFRMIGIKFRTGALYSVKHLLPESSALSLEKIKRADTNLLMGLDWFFYQTLLNEGTEAVDKVCDSLDESLSRFFLNIQDDKHSVLVRQILPLLSNTSIASIGSTVHRSQRTIERSFLRVTELTLKQCQSMMRLEDVLNYLYQLDEAEIDWADLVDQFDFSDQPHLIRHLKSAIGKTPGEYARERDLTIDIYGDFKLT
jgi:AraC-like DNA-binding protein